MEKERRNFQETKDVIQSEIQREADFLDFLRRDSREHNREMVRETSADYSDPIVRVELSQYLQSYRNNEIRLQKSKERLDKLLKMYKKPYFGRLDFNGEKLYFGISHLFDKETMDIKIFDWRSPIGSLYYENKYGQLSYESPDGIVSGDVTLKRQFLVEDEELLDYYDLKENIPDEQLLQVLKSKDAKHLTSIVETIQKKQNDIIRMKDLELLFVRGVPGSGKSIIAMHRLAYLMYHGKKYNHQNIMIMSPNHFFKDYLDHVLPDLGEKNVNQITYEEILLNEFPDAEDYRMFMDRVVKRKSTPFKQTEDYYHLIKSWFRYYLACLHPYEDLYYHNEILIKKEQIRHWFLNNFDKVPLSVFSDKISAKVLSDLEYKEKEVYEKLREITINLGNHPLDLKKAVKRKLQNYNNRFKQRMKRCLSLDPITIYQAMFKHRKQVYKIADMQIPRTFFYKHNGYDDYNGIFLYKTWIQHLQDYRHFKYLVIDEAQDYNSIQYKIIKKLFYNAHYSVLGDMNQTVHHHKTEHFYSMLQKSLQVQKTMNIELDICYRSTENITAYANQFLQKPVTAFSRAGKSIVHDTNISNHLKDSVQTAIIVHSSQEAKSLSKTLKLPCLTSHFDSLNHEKIIIPIYYAKGLEFDRVIYVNSKVKHPLFKQYIYTASTRAKHELVIINR